MKAIIRIDVPDYQIGQEVSCYFKDTMNVYGVCEAERTGHWEWVQYESNPNIGNFHCSECRFIPLKISNYCPNCGARMVGDNNE